MLLPKGADKTKILGIPETYWGNDWRNEKGWGYSTLRRCSPGVEYYPNYIREWEPLASLLTAWRREESETAQFSEFSMILVPLNLEAGREIICYLSLYHNGLVWYLHLIDSKVCTRSQGEDKMESFD